MAVSHGVAWTEAMRAACVRLVEDGLSASQVAAKLNAVYGINLSRNAVIGALARIGGYNRHKPERSEKKRAPSPKRRAPWRPQPVVTAERVPIPEPPAPDHDIPLPQRKTLMDLTEDTCRWPVGDPGSPGFFFCGAQPVHERPYCAAHCRRAYAPASSLRPFSAYTMRRFAA